MDITRNYQTLELIGDTPLIKLQSLSKLTGNNIWIKWENRNLCGSIKDRVAKQMILDAIDDGTLKPGMIILEGTSGNTGISLALIGRILGYQVHIVLPENIAREKRELIQLYGATLKLVPETCNPCDVAKKIYEKGRTKYWFANQFYNVSNIRAHYSTTGPEVFRQLQGKVDILVTSAGTGGTICGTSKFLKERLQSNVQTVLVDPEGSIYSNYLNGREEKSRGSSFLEGIGLNHASSFINLGKEYIDEAFTLPDSHAVAIAYYVKEKDGIAIGSSTALNICGALRKAIDVKDQNKNIVTFMCDSGERTLSKLYNSKFLEEKGLSDQSVPTIDEIIDQYSNIKGEKTFISHSDA